VAFADDSGFGFCDCHLFQNARGKLLLHRFLLKLPIAGALIKQMTTAQLSRSLSTLLSGGITVPDSWDIASHRLIISNCGGAVRRFCR
jgi:type II secretory pathway component PulF